MRLIALLCWYEENPAWLAGLVASLAGVCDHLVAVDGAYVLFPDALSHPASGAEQREALLQAAHGAGIGCTLHAPQGPWLGNEVEKRSFLFELGELVAEPMRDWYLVIDGDELVARAPSDLRERLEATELHTGAVSLMQRSLDPDDPSPLHTLNRAHRPLFRAIPGLHVQGAHYVNVADLDGERLYLRGNHGAHELEPALDLTDMVVEHRHVHRSHGRDVAASDYYATRDAVGAERLRTIVMQGVDGELVARP